MKNIHLIPTTPNDETAKGVWIEKTRDWCNIYITSDEYIKDGDWCINSVNELLKVSNLKSYKYHFKKIILTTDQDLIKDDVQAIDDEFLQWFVKNPSCEEVKVEFKSQKNTK